MSASMIVLVAVFVGLTLARIPIGISMLAGGVAYLDPRLAEMGARFVLHAGLGEDPLIALGCVRVEPEEYHALRIANGLPDGSRDMAVDKAILLENGFDEFGGVDWKKGCYIGQELTARTKYRGLIKKRLMPVAVEGPMPPSGTLVDFDGQEAGEMRSGHGHRALALLRLKPSRRRSPKAAR